jgi:MoaA/NifB/PqqE/SkfB family radical SAM enzyme
MDDTILQSLKDSTSQTLCLAKFHEATVWLYNSRIASCHHTPLVPTGNTTLTFFNPAEKREQQRKMLAGERPEECGYCWKLEDQNLTSDRYKKSRHFKSAESAESYLNPEFDFKPKTLELAFQNVCNLACSYCSPQFSNSWENDIKQNGVYENLHTDQRLHYQRGIDNHVPVDMELFWTWFDSVASGIESFRITGGEPLLHEDTFKLFEKMSMVNTNAEFVIHTNLCQKPVVIDRFIANIKNFPNIRMNISNESAGEVAEFIRDGMVYTEWLENVRKVAQANAAMSISTSITAISLINLDQLYTDIINLRKDTAQKPYISINFVTYPEFQSLAVLTWQERAFYLKHYRAFFEKIDSQLLDVERSHVQRLLAMLGPDLAHADQVAYRKDSDSFFEQYSQRRSKAINWSQRIGTMLSVKEPPATLCRLPWQGFSNDPDGKVRPCCLFKDHIRDDAGELMYVQQSTVQEIFHTKFMKDLREQFRNGERPSACSTCWTDEANGYKSKRLTYNEIELDGYILDWQGEPDLPDEYQMIINNSCNLKCRSCAPSHSSLWATELKAMKIGGTEYKMPFAQAGDELGKLWSDRHTWYKSLKRLEIVGGEPFYVKQWHTIFEELIELGLSKDIYLNMSTNCTLFFPELLDKICKNFKFVGIGLSIDGTGGTYEYLRHPGKWDVVLENMRKYHDMTNKYDNLHIMVSHTISWINAYELPKIHELIDNELPNFKIWNNIVHHPEHLPIWAIPQNFKDAISANWDTYTWQEQHVESINSVRKYMYSKDITPEQFVENLKILRRTDKFRKEDLLVSVPILRNYIGTHWKKLFKPIF